MLKGFSAVHVVFTGIVMVFILAVPLQAQTTWEWDFGDGTRSTLQNPTHVYQQPGTYTWTMTVTINGISCSKSGSITITQPCVPPSISSHPSNRTITSGQTATLSVNAVGTTPLRYQWYQGSRGDTSKPVGTNSPNYTTPALAVTTAFWVRVSNSCGSSDSNAAMVTVQAACTPPSISSHPSSLTINNGQTTRLIVSASGTSLSYQWYRGSSGNTQSPIPGATSSSYTTPVLSATTSYWVRVSNSCGSANSNTATITVRPATTGQIELLGLEVTQGIQHMQNSVVLIEGRKTFVRAHVRSTTGQDVSGVEARLYGYDGNGNQLSVPGQFNDYLIPSNDDYDKSLGGTVLASPSRGKSFDNFLFLLPESWANDLLELRFESVPPISQLDCREPLERRCVWQSGDPPYLDCTDDLSSQKDCKVTVIFRPRTTIRLNIWELTFDDAGEEISPDPVAETARAVQDVRDRLPVSEVIPVFHKGLNINKFLPEPGKFGKATDLINAIKRNRILRAFKSVLKSAGEYPGSKSGEIFVGLLPGARGGISDDIPSDLVIGSVESVVHELGHALGRHHTSTGLGESDPGFYPYDDGNISNWSDRNSYSVGDLRAYYGFQAVGNFGIPRKPSDKGAMGWAVFQRVDWISDYTYDFIYQSLVSRASTVNSKLDHLLQAEMRFVSVDGFIDFADSSGQINSVYQPMTSAPDPLPSTGNYTLRLEGPTATNLADYSFEPIPDVEFPRLGSFQLDLPWNSQIRRVVLLQGNRELDSRTASSAAPVIDVLFPDGGETLSGNTAVFRWSANDSDGDSLKYTVLYSPDQGTTWLPLASDWEQTQFEVSLADLPGSNNALIKVFADDGFHTSEDQSTAAFVVPRNSPEVMILSPEGGTLAGPASSISLDGLGIDNEDGTLPDSALTWRSNLAGTLGTGKSVTVRGEQLGAGTHTITLTASDSDGQTGSKSVQVQVSGQPVQPQNPTLSASSGSCQIPNPGGRCLIGLTINNPAGKPLQLWAIDPMQERFLLAERSEKSFQLDYLVSAGTHTLELYEIVQGVRQFRDSVAIQGIHPFTPEPTVNQYLSTNLSEACPGFYIAGVTLQPGAKPGMWGIEVAVTSGSRELAGGLNLGGGFEADNRNPAWGAFNLANATQEPQRVNIHLEAQPIPTPGFSEQNFGLQVQLLRAEGDNRIVVGNPVIGRPPLQFESIVDPGFYIVEVRSLPGSPAGTFQMSAETSFVNRAGGGFQGGAVVGGYLTFDSFGQSLKGFAAFCISDSQNVKFTTFGESSFGSVGAGDLILTIFDRNRDVVWQSQTSTATTTTTTVHTATTTTTTTTASSTTTTTIGGLIGLPFGYIDSPANGSVVSGVIAVSGYAAGGLPLTRVSLLVDGNFGVQNIILNIPRPDVCAVLPGYFPCPNVGFSISYNTGGLSLGEHQLRLQITDTEGRIGNSLNTVSVTKVNTPISAGNVYEVDSIVGNLRYVPAGTFTQGSPESEDCRFYLSIPARVSLRTH